MASGPAPPLLLAVDGNSLLHRAHHAWADSCETDRNGRPIWGLIGLLVAIGSAAARCRPDALLVGFDCGRHSIRREAFAAYKAHRPDKPAALLAQLEDAPALLVAAGVPVAQVGGHEADDVLASAAALARAEGWRSVLVTSDRDAFALIDQTTSVLRVVNGGIDDSPLLTPADLVTQYRVEPGRYRDLAALRGDPSDNLRGAPGVGNRTAARLLEAFGSLDGVFAALDDGAEGDVVAVAGEAAAAHLGSAAGRAELHRTRSLMVLRDDLPLPPLADLRLPLDGVRVRTALRAKEIRLTRSLWALVGEEPPAWEPNGFDSAPSVLPRVALPPWALSQWYRPAVVDVTDEATGSEGGESKGGKSQGARSRVPAVGPAAAGRRVGRAPAPAPPGQLTLF